MTTNLTLDEYVSKFETKLLQSLLFRYRHTPKEHIEILLRGNFVKTFDIKEFLYVYRSNTTYPAERIDSLADKLIDIKLEMYLIELDLGIDNTMTGIIFSEAETDERTAHIDFMHMAINQSVILKSRILWERVMNCIYYLETGNELDETLQERKSGNSPFSKKTKFFDFINDTDDNSVLKWSFLNDYREYVNWFDDKWRTPETHKHSTLRARFLNETMSSDDVNRILGLLGIVTNAFYVNFMSIIKGDEPGYRFWTYGMSDDKKLR